MIKSLSLLLIALCLISTRALAEVPYRTWQCYTFDSSTVDPLYQRFLKLAADIKEASGGRINVSCHPGGSLPINSEDITQSISTGTIQFALGDSSYSSVIPAAGVLQLPGLYADEAQLASAAKALTPFLKEQFAARNIVMLGIASYPRQVLWSTQKLTSLSDLKGLKIRVTNPEQGEFASRFGATPLTLGMSDVPTALQRGVIQGVLTANVGGGIVWHGLVHYNLRTGPNFVTIALLANKTTFDALPQDLQDKILSLCADASQQMTALLLSRENGMTADFEKDGLIVTPGTPADELAIRQRMEPYWAEWARQHGADAQKALSIVEASQKP